MNRFNGTLTLTFGDRSTVTVHSLDFDQANYLVGHLEDSLDGLLEAMYFPYPILLHSETY